jgi:hypothetical protein
MLVILSAWLFAYYFVNVAGIPNAIKRGFKMKAGTRIKPFDCVTCLSVWSAAAFYFIPACVLEFIAIIFGAGMVGNIDWITFLRDVLYKIGK